MIASKKTVKNNHVGKHCDMLINDFFNFYEGKADKVTVIDIRDIKEPMPPEQEQMRKMMARCRKAWFDYCEFVGLSRNSRTLFVNRVKKEWQRRAQQETKQLQSRKRPDATN